MRLILRLFGPGLGLLAALCFGVLLHASAASAFEADVRPVLSQTCSGCHNAQVASGGLNLAPFLDASSIASNREGWERILVKLRAGEMPPKGIPKPAPEKMEALLRYVQGEFDRADRGAKPDPGRVTAHRLNRNEYSNTIRDLLGVDFRADKNFPSDDSSGGFDNMSDVLT